MTSLKKLFQKLRTILWYLNTCIYIVILQENGVFSWFSDHYTLSFGWDSYFVAESYSVLHYASDKVQWSCLLWSAEFIDPLYTKSSHCVFCMILFLLSEFYQGRGLNSFREKAHEKIREIFMKMIWKIFMESFDLVLWSKMCKKYF